MLLFAEDDINVDKEFEALYREEKAQAVNKTLNTLKKGMEEAEVCQLSCVLKKMRRIEVVVCW